MRVALVHDWLTGMRGGEKCLECFGEMYPDADLYTLIHTKGKCSKIIEDRNIFTSFVDKIPTKDRYYRHMLPLFPVAIERFILKDYDLILSSSHCVAKGIIPGPDSLHVSYVHSPMRYVWDMYEDYFGKDKVNAIFKMVIPFFATYLRAWDVASSGRVDYFVANSNHVAHRIKKYYRRDAEVIHPPVDLDRFKMSKKTDDYYLMVSALVSYKRLDLAIEAFNRLGLKLKIVGSGPDEARLRSIAGPGIEFIGWATDEEVTDLYSRCSAFIFPGEEDFGITPLEAMASGRPVIAYARGGALETIKGVDDKNPTGLFFHEQNIECLAAAVKEFEEKRELFDPKKIRKHASQWKRERFKKEMAEIIEKYQKSGS